MLSDPVFTLPLIAQRLAWYAPALDLLIQSYTQPLADNGVQGKMHQPRSWMMAPPYA